MVKEIAVLDCKVGSKVPDMRQIEEENIVFGYLKNESVFQPLQKIVEASFEYKNWKELTNSCIPFSE